MDLVKSYRYYMKELADPRTQNWLFMEDLSAISIIIVTYLFIVKKAGPQFMENRKPYNLKKVIQIYNMFQIIACTLLTYGILSNGWFQKRYTIYCSPIDYSDDPIALGIANMVWWTMILKMAELIETVFFVMRKKYNQVSYLHLYHHTSTLLIAWFGTKYIAGGMATFPIIVNNIIHIFMYSYYLASTFGPSWQKRLAKWKNKLTIMQMIQFCILLIHSTQALHKDCNVPIIAPILFMPNVLLVFYLFYDFYQKAYTKQTPSPKKHH